MGMRCHLYSAPTSAAQKLLEDPEGFEEFFDSVSGEAVRLEKSWHGLHYLFTGTAWEGDDPLCFLLMGGESVGEQDEEEEDVLPRILMPDYVQQLNSALTEITNEEFDRRFDIEQFAVEELYPQIWSEPREDLLSEYRMYFDALQKFVKSAAKRKEAILVMLG
jgi:hypothetical protein